MTPQSSTGNAAAMERLHTAVRDAHAGRRPALTADELHAFAREIRPDADASIEIESLNDEPLIVVRARSRVRPGPSLSVLSARELEVAQHIAAGLTNAEIAGRLGIQIGTVKDHVHRILERLGVKSRQHVVALVVADLERASRAAN